MNILIYRRWTLSKELNKYKMRRLRNKPRKAFCAMEVCFYYVGALSNWTGRWIILNWFTFTWLFRVVPAVAAELWGIVQLFRPSLSLSLYSTPSLLGPVKRLICITYQTKHQLKQLIYMSCDKSNLI